MYIVVEVECVSKVAYAVSYAVFRSTFFSMRLVTLKKFWGDALVAISIRVIKYCIV